MCNPIALVLLSTVVTTAGQLHAGDVQKEIGDKNAKRADLQAEAVLKQGEIDKQAQRDRTAQIRGAQMAAMGASGAAAGEGTLGLVLDQTSTMGKMDELTIGNNAINQAWGLQGQAENFRANGNAGRQAGLWGGAGTLVTGASKAYGIYNDPKKAA